MRILIAEDDPISRRVLETLLLKWGHDVTVTCDGAQAWDALQNADAPPLVVLDWMMPNTDGVEVCRRIRALPPGRCPYVIMLTAKGRKEDIVEGLEAGADDFIVKPFDSTELRARVNAGVRIVQLQTDLAKRVNELEQALAKVTKLQGLLPICCYCKNVRKDDNYWQEVEAYVSEHAGVRFTHGICPQCYEQHVAREIQELRAQTA